MSAIEHRAVDAYRGIGARIFLDMIGVERGPEYALSSIATLNRAVEVVPMVQDAQLEKRLRLAALAPQQGVGTIHQAFFRLGLDGAPADDIPLVVGHVGVEHQLGLGPVIIAAQLVGSHTFGSRHLRLVHLGIAQPQPAAVLCVPHHSGSKQQYCQNLSFHITCF